MTSDNLRHPLHGDQPTDDSPDALLSGSQDRTVEAEGTDPISRELNDEGESDEAPRFSIIDPTRLAATGQPGARHALSPLAQTDNVEQSDDLDDHEANGAVGPSGRGAAAPSSARLSLVTASSPGEQQRIAEALDKLSLEQALLDVEVANARVIDLTSRLVEANQRAAAARAEADALRAHITALEAADDVRRQSADAELAARQATLDAQAAHLDAQKASTAYRWAAKVWNLRNALRS